MYTEQTDKGAVPQCKSCGSSRVVKDAWACWNPETGLWELEAVFDHTHCHQCDGETKLVWSKPTRPSAPRIRELNDCFREFGSGHGTVVFTAGVQDLGPAVLRDVFRAVQSFDGFTGDNDPWGEHDFGAVEVSGEKIFWKIDYYAPDLVNGSKNPANELQTFRVLTIMLASEY